MNKIFNLKQILYAIIVIVLCLTCQKTQAQSDKVFAKDSSVSSSKPKKPIYVDGSLGLLSFGGDGFFITGATDINIGYAYSKEQAVGLSYISWLQPSDCCATNASGVGVQWRKTSSENRLLFKVEAGYVLSAYYGDDAGYEFNYNHQKSSKLYFRATAAMRFGAMTLGATLATTSNQINDTFDTSTKQYLKSYPFSVKSLTIGVGFAVPKYRKKRT